MIKHWLAPRPHDIAPTIDGFLEQLGGPTWIEMPGRDRNRRRVLSTLLHGNEPSGLRALHHILQQGLEPAVDMHCFIGSVMAALEPPLFSHRHLPGVRDLNRCFTPPFVDEPGEVALAVLTQLAELKPEGLIDLHNTSGSGPAFGVAIREDWTHDALVAFFCHRLVITDIRLGALMEYSEQAVPTVTVECGGAYDAEADAVALRGMENFWLVDDLFEESQRQPPPMQLLRHPLRLELAPDATIGYGETYRSGDDLTLPFDVEGYNFRTIETGERLGWLGEEGLAALRVRGGNNQYSVSDYFQAEQRELKARMPMTMFMITTDPDIARSDCIGYFVGG